MVASPQTGITPETMVKVLVTIIDKTVAGGATRDDLKDAYSEVKGKVPSDRSIYRIINRLNKLFSPLAYSGGNRVKGKGCKAGKVKGVPLTIESVKDHTGKTRYRYNSYRVAGNRQSKLALTVILGLYSQQRGILKGHFEKVIQSLLQEAIAGKHDEDFFFTEADRHIYVSGFGSADPQKILYRISEIIRAIDNCKVIKFYYTRTKDGAVVRREVEPYGLVCRHGSWYLVGLCRQKQSRRIYLLDQVKRMEVVENSVFKRQVGFSLKTVFNNAWGIWNLDDKDLSKIDVVRLKAAKGVAERFKAISFHHTQKVKTLPGGEAEVTYKISGAQEMIPFLLSWGAGLEVLEPAWLRDEVLADLQKILTHYSGR